MCIISVVPKFGPVPKREMLEFCWEQNPHNGGFMYIKDGRLVIHKHDKMEDYLNHFYEVYTPESPFVLHMRYATHGTVKLENTHPFRIDKTMAFVHNGVIHKCTPDKKQEAEEDISDTRNFRNKILRKLPRGWFASPLMRALLANYIGQSKIVILHQSGEYAILNEGQGDWTDVDGKKSEPGKGIWWSNDYYKRKRVPDQTIYSSGPTDFRFACHVCNSKINGDPIKLLFRAFDKTNTETFFRMDVCQDCGINIYTENNLKFIGNYNHCSCCEKELVFNRKTLFFSEFNYEYYDLRWDGFISNQALCGECLSKMWTGKKSHFGCSFTFLSKEGKIFRDNLVTKPQLDTKPTLSLPPPVKEVKTKACGCAADNYCWKCRPRIQGQCGGCGKWSTQLKDGLCITCQYDARGRRFKTCRVCGGSGLASMYEDCAACGGAGEIEISFNKTLDDELTEATIVGGNA